MVSLLRLWETAYCFLMNLMKILVIGNLYGVHCLVLDMKQGYFCSWLFQIFQHSTQRGGHIYLFIAYDWSMKSWLGLGIGVAWDLWVGNIGRKDSNPFLSVTNSCSPHIDFFLDKGRIVMVSLITKLTKVRIIGDVPLGISLGELLKCINWESVAGGHLFIPAA